MRSARAEPGARAVAAHPSVAGPAAARAVREEHAGHGEHAVHVTAHEGPRPGAAAAAASRRLAWPSGDASVARGHRCRGARGAARRDSRAQAARGDAGRSCKASSKCLDRPTDVSGRVYHVAAGRTKQSFANCAKKSRRVRRGGRRLCGLKRMFQPRLRDGRLADDAKGRGGRVVGDDSAVGQHDEFGRGRRHRVGEADAVGPALEP